MSKLFFACVICAASALAAAQSTEDLVRKPRESPSDFAQRVKSPEETVTYEVLVTGEWDSTNPSIMAFYQVPYAYGQYPEVIGHLYMKQYDADYYRDIVFGDFIGESDYPEILDVFWLNLDADGEKEVLILYKSFLRHYDFTGYVYDVAIFDNPPITSDSLEQIAPFGSLFISFEGNNGEGLESIPLYTSRESVIEKIRELRGVK